MNIETKEILTGGQISPQYNTEPFDGRVEQPAWGDSRLLSPQISHQSDMPLARML